MLPNSHPDPTTAALLNLVQFSPLSDTADLLEHTLRPYARGVQALVVMAISGVALVVPAAAAPLALLGMLAGRWAADLVRRPVRELREAAEAERVEAAGRAAARMSRRSEGAEETGEEGEPIGFVLSRR